MLVISDRLFGRRRTRGCSCLQTQRAWRSSRVHVARPRVPSFRPRRIKARCRAPARWISRRRFTRSVKASTRNADREMPSSTAKCFASRRTSLGSEIVTFCFSTCLRVPRAFTVSQMNRSLLEATRAGPLEVKDASFGGTLKRAFTFHFCPKASLRKRQSMSLSSGISSVIFNCSFARRISASRLLFATRPSTFSERNE
jgi:hypothetical protein